MAEDTTQTAAQSTDAAGAEGTTETTQDAATTEQTTQQQPPVDVNAAAAQAAVASAEKPWYADLPETTHEALKGFKDADELAAAAARGKDYIPAKDISEYKITFAQEMPGSEAVVAKYAEFCLQAGITPQQAQAAVTWQEQLAEETRERFVEAGTTELKDKWGTKFEANRTQALVALQALDRRMDGRLAPAMAANGMTNDPVVIEALHLISTAISEDSLGTGGPGADPNKEEDPVSALRNLGFQ